MIKLMDLLETDTIAEINGKWVPARQVPCCRRCRMRDAWAVLTGKADAIIWPTDGGITVEEEGRD